MKKQMTKKRFKKIYAGWKRFNSLPSGNAIKRNNKRKKVRKFNY